VYLIKNKDKRTFTVLFTRQIHAETKGLRQARHRIPLARPGTHVRTHTQTDGQPENIMPPLTRKPTRNSAAADGQRDAPCKLKLCQLYNKLYNKSTTNRSILELEGYTLPTFSKQPRPIDCCIGVVNKLDHPCRRRVLLTTRSSCPGEIF